MAVQIKVTAQIKQMEKDTSTYRTLAPFLCTLHQLLQANHTTKKGKLAP